MKVQAATIALDDEQRTHIARYLDACNGRPWCDDDGNEIEGKERLATHDECAEYASFALAESLQAQEIKDHANQAEGAI